MGLGLGTGLGLELDSPQTGNAMERTHHKIFTEFSQMGKWPNGFTFMRFCLAFAICQSCAGGKRRAISRVIGEANRVSLHVCVLHKAD